MVDVIDTQTFGFVHVNCSVRIFRHLVFLIEKILEQTVLNLKIEMQSVLMIIFNKMYAEKSLFWRVIAIKVC